MDAGMIKLTFLLTAILVDFTEIQSADVFCGQLHVDLTISALSVDNKARYLEVSWINAVPQPGEWVGLFNFDPMTSVDCLSCLPLFVIHVNESKSGWFRTNTIVDDFMSENDLKYESKCLGVWVAYVKSDNATVLASNCFRSQPTWMSDSKSKLSSMKLTDLFIPGTHDSGTYTKYNASESVVSKYSITQEESFLHQLIYGIRYIDLRVAYYSKDDPVWWVNHGIVKFRPLQDVLADVKTFIMQTQEIVIVDAHEFPQGFGSDLTVHKQLESYLKSQLGDLTASKSLTWKSTLGEVWSGGRRLVLSYNNNELVRDSDFLWPGVNQQWGDVNTLPDLYDYLAKVNNNHPSDTAWAAMAELTATATDIILDRLGGLRDMANSVNHNVTEWYYGDWGQNVNIVACDFFKNTAIIDTAIRWNLKKATGDTSCN